MIFHSNAFMSSFSMMRSQAKDKKKLKIDKVKNEKENNFGST